MVCLNRLTVQGEMYFVKYHTKLLMFITTYYHKVSPHQLSKQNLVFKTLSFEV